MSATCVLKPFWLKPFSAKTSVIACVSPLKGVLTSLALVVFWFLARLLFVENLCVRSSNFRGDTLLSVTLFCVPILDTITPFDPVSDSTPAAVVIEIDEDSAFTEAHDSLRVLLSYGKRQSVEMNASGPVREEGEAGNAVPSTTGTAEGGMQVEDDIGDIDDALVVEPGSERLKVSHVATDLLVLCAQDAACKATCDMKACTSQLMQDAVVRDQRMAVCMVDCDAAAALAERDAALAAKLEGLVKAVSESVDTKIRNLSASVDGKLDNTVWKTFENTWTDKIVHPDDKGGCNHPGGIPCWCGSVKRCRREMEDPHGK